MDYGNSGLYAIWGRDLPFFLRISS